MSFDEQAARERYLAGFQPGRTSTQSWDVDLWTEDWRDPSGELQPGSLGADGGAWWFRAFTDAGRLTGASGELTADPLTAVSARARIAAFIGEADQVLLHWPQQSLAPAAFALREAVGPAEALAILVETLDPDVLADFIGWLGPLDEDVAGRWFSQLRDARAVASLGEQSGTYKDALKRLKALGALAEADELAKSAPPQLEAAWVRAARRPVHVDFLARTVDVVDDETFAILARRCRAKRDRRYWEVVAKRLGPDLVPPLLDRIKEPVAPWVFQAFGAGGDDTIDVLIDVAAGRKSKRRDAAVLVLSKIDQLVVRMRLEEVDEAVRTKVTAALTPRPDLPELPRADWPSWLGALAGREPVPTDWLDPVALPPLDTKSGHRLPLAVSRGLLAVLQQVRLSSPDDRGGRDHFDTALAELRGLLDAESANQWWHALFAMWWSDHRPDAQWVMYAAAFLCDGRAIRDLGASLSRRNAWFGNLSSRVVVTIGHSETAWAVAALDSIGHTAHSFEHRSVARSFLQQRADQAGRTVNRFVLENFPDDDDPILIESAARRFEHAMVEQAPWLPRATDKKAFRYVGQSTVFCVTNSWGERRFFRLDEDECIDVDGAPVEIPADDLVTVAHAAQLSDTLLACWHEHFADYELIQRFDQLERPRFRAGSLSRDGFVSPVGLTVSGPQILSAARHRGWVPRRQGAHGDIVWLERTFEELDVRACLRFGDPLEEDGYGESEVVELGFTTLHSEPLEAQDVPPTAFSEAHLDVTRLMPKET